MKTKERKQEKKKRELYLEKVDTEERNTRKEKRVIS